MSVFRPFARGLYNTSQNQNSTNTSESFGYSNNNSYDSRELDYYVDKSLKRKHTDSFNFWAAAGGMTAAGAAGFIATRNGENLWSKYIRGIEHAEGLSPFQVLRTFRVSEFLSPLGAPSSIKYSPSSYSHLLSSPAFQDYISKITGLSSSRLDELSVFDKGFEFRRTGTSVLGGLYTTSGKLLKDNVGLLSTGYGPSSGFTAEWFARVAGARSPKGFLTPFADGEITRAPGFVPISAPGGQRQLAKQYGHAIFSAGVGRLNLLLQSPFQTDLFKNLAKKAPFLNKLAPNIKQGTSLQMLGRYTALAGKVGLAIHGIKYLDYLQREEGTLASLPRNTVVGGLIGAALTKTKKGAMVGAAVLGGAGLLPSFGEEGFIGGALDIYANLRVDLARLTSPWRAGSKRAEDNFKGITEVKTLVGFAGTGLLLGGAYEYFDRLKTISKVYKSTKASGNQLYEITEEVVKQRREKVAAQFAAVAKNAEGSEKFIAEWLGKWKSSPGYTKGLVAGAGVFGALSAVGSLVSGDILGAATTAAGFAGAGYAFAKGKPILAGLAALATFTLRGDETPEELRAIYSGEELVESRRGRWWEIGKTPWQGKRPYYRKHRIALYKEHAREEALFGGESKYWETDPILNPVSFLLDPYEREKLMWEQGWKFPVTQTPLEDFPILGPVLAATIGQIIKPTKYIERDMWMEPEGIGSAPSGYSNIPAREPGKNINPSSTMGEMFYRISEASGLPGFVSQSIMESITGEETPFTRPELMSPSVVAGIEPGYWGLNLGGLAGFSEGIRRFIPRHRRDVDRVNPMPSGLPDWLPNGNSEYFIDFSRADVYTKLDEAWARLPGAGLAAAKFPELKGINPNDYPAFYRYMVLADIAPWSQEYKRYSSFMSELSDSGQLTPEQLMKISETKKQVAEVKRRKDFDRYKYDMDQVRRHTVNISGQVDTGLYLTKEFGTAPVQLAGLNTSVAALARVAKTQNPQISGTEAFRQAEKKKILLDDYIREQSRSGQLDIYTHRDPSMLMKRTAAGPIVPAVLIGKAGENINRELVNLGLAEKAEQDESVLANMAGVNFLQKSFGSFWENLLHGMETPLETLTPVAPTAKFIHQRSPLEDYQRSRIYSRDVAMWDKPIQNFIAPGLRTVAWWAGWRGLPQDVRQRYMVEEYFDRLEHEKQKRLESAAIAAGQGDLAAAHASKAVKTMTGAKLFSSHQVYMALPKAERDYFKAFVEAPTREEREEIARYVSPQMRQALEAQWLQKEMEGASMRLEAGIGTAEDKQVIKQYWNKRAAISRRKTRMSQKNYPPPDWVGWCMHEDQQIILEDGTFELVKNIKEGEFLYKNNQVKKIFKRTIKPEEKLINISVKSISNGLLRVTENHKVLVRRGSQNIFIPAKEIESSDFLCKRKITKEEKSLVLDISKITKRKIKIKEENVHYSGRGKNNSCKQFFEISPEFMWILGYYAAEGNLAFRKGLPRAVCFTQSLNEAFFYEKVQKYFKKTFGENVLHYERKRGCGSSRELRINNPFISEVFHLLLPGNCYSKKIIDLSIFVSKDHIEQFLLGLFAGDASKTETNRTVLSTVSKSLSEQVSLLLSSINIVHSFYIQDRKNRRRRYLLSVFTYDKGLSFTKVINGYLKNKTRPSDKNNPGSCFDKHLFDEQFHYIKINSIEISSFSGTVYDISMSGLHEIPTNLGIIHNSPAVQLRDVKLKTILEQDESMFDYGFWPSDVREVERRPYVEPISHAFGESQGPGIPETLNAWREQLQMSGEQGYHSYTAGASGVNQIEVVSSGQGRVDRYLRDPTISTFGY